MDDTTSLFQHPVTLTGRVAQLQPLSLDHVPDLTLAGADSDIWRYMLYGPVTTEAHMKAWVQALLEWQAGGADLPFAVIHIQSGRAVGATRYLDMRPQHRAVEIGGTWYSPDFQRTAVNTECKYLLLKHAFETLGCIRVQLKTDLRNERSQRAIERLGAVREGVLRNHMILPDGIYRHSVYYSIVENEWPMIRQRLVDKLGYAL